MVVLVVLAEGGAKILLLLVEVVLADSAGDEER